MEQNLHCAASTHKFVAGFTQVAARNSNTQDSKQLSTTHTNTKALYILNRK
jgi:hypothetical protein